MAGTKSPQTGPPLAGIGLVVVRKTGSQHVSIANVVPGSAPCELCAWVIAGLVAYSLTVYTGIGTGIFDTCGHAHLYTT